MIAGGQCFRCPLESSNNDGDSTHSISACNPRDRLLRSLPDAALDAGRDSSLQSARGPRSQGPLCRVRQSDVSARRVGRGRVRSWAIRRKLLRTGVRKN